VNGFVPEKRESGRVVKKLEICFGSYSEFIETYTENVGMGGLFVHTEDPAKIGDQVYLQFNLPGTDHMIQCEGEVKWLKKKGQRYLGMGISFSSLRREDKEYIDNYVHRMLP
jgi:uncharacterized protein (TIGR02266 family)